VRVRGHAIEARVYAEDPYAGFLPRAGRADLAQWPAEPVRVDTALRTGDLVTTAYDRCSARSACMPPTGRRR
jgi:acetyl/propionyl-CoA carboxylase alpha subunit